MLTHKFDLGHWIHHDPKYHDDYFCVSCERKILFTSLAGVEYLFRTVASDVPESKGFIDGNDLLLLPLEVC